MLQILIDSNGFVIFLICLVKPILQNFDLLLEVVLILSPRVHTYTVLFLFNNFFLEVGNMNVDIVLDLFLLLDGCVYLCQELLHILHGLVVVGIVWFIIIYFGLALWKYVRSITWEPRFIFLVYQPTFSASLWSL